MITVTSTTGVRFNVRIIRKGDRYGLDDCLVVGEGRAATLEGNGPLVEFYDSRWMHTPRGQFVSRYGVDTILASHGGLDLMSYEPSWKIDEAAMGIVRQWLRDEMARHYSVGLPVSVTVHHDGRVEITVDLAEIDDIDEDDGAYERYSNLQIIQDTTTVSEAAGRIGNACTTVIYPNRSNA